MEGSATFRVFWGPDESHRATAIAESSSQSETVTLSLMEILPLLTEAVSSERTWLRDFEEDEVTISADLYEMLMAYQHHWRPSA